MRSLATLPLKLSWSPLLVILTLCVPTPSLKLSLSLARPLLLLPGGEGGGGRQELVIPMLYTHTASHWLHSHNSLIVIPAVSLHNRCQHLLWIFSYSTPLLWHQVTISWVTESADNTGQCWAQKAAPGVTMGKGKNKSHRFLGKTHKSGPFKSFYS